jgi:hypothetical protein
MEDIGRMAVPMIVPLHPLHDGPLDTEVHTLS